MTNNEVSGVSFNLREVVRGFGRWPSTPAQARCRDAMRELKRCESLVEQNLHIEPSDRGWVLRFESVAETGRLSILIPCGATDAPEVLEDSRSASKQRNIDDLLRLGGFREAASIVERQIRDCPSDDSSRELIELRFKLAVIYRELGFYNRAALLLGEDMPRASSDASIPPSMRVNILHESGLNQFLHASGTTIDFASTNAILQEATSLAKTLLELDSDIHAKLLATRGRVAAASYRYREAIPLLESAIERFERSAHRDQGDLAETIGELACVRMSLEDYQVAGKEFQRSVEHFEAGPAECDPRFARVLFSFSEFQWYVTGEQTNARQTLSRALEILERTTGLDHPYVRTESSFINKVLPDSELPTATMR